MNSKVDRVKIEDVGYSQAASETISDMVPSARNEESYPASTAKKKNDKI